MHDEPVDPGVAFRGLKESLGSLMFCWCRLEDALASLTMPSGRSAAAGKPVGEQLADLRRRVAENGRNRATPPELADLVRRIDQVRRLRNLIVHHLAGVSSDPLKGEPHITCERLAGGRRSSVRITQTELSELLAGIDRCRGDLGRMGFWLDGLTNGRP